MRMGNEIYQQRLDLNLTYDNQGIIVLPNNLVLYITQEQADAAWKALCDYAEQNGRVKSYYLQGDYISKDGQPNITPQSTLCVPENRNSLEDAHMVLKINDGLRLSQTDANYNPSEENRLPETQNFEDKVKKWLLHGLITTEQYNSVIRGILYSSGTIHNDWVYAFSGENREAKGEEPLILDIHDRRLDDDSQPLTVKGGINVGNPDHPEERKKLSVFGETELQDGTSFGRLLDTYGEQFPMAFGHLIPNHGQYPKVYINRGEDRYNGEDWDENDSTIIYWKYNNTEDDKGWQRITKTDIPSDASVISVNRLPETPDENAYYSTLTYTPYYGAGFGTIEAYKEIISHTTVNADRGMIIEDGVGDYTDREIQKTVKNGKNYFDPALGSNLTHQTHGFALSIHHDGAKIQGHTYVQDEGIANRFFKDGEQIYRVNASNTRADNNGNVTNFTPIDDFQIFKGCWFCDDNTPASNDSQYRHYCTNTDNEVEPVIDKWYGHLYCSCGDLTIKGREGYKYRIYQNLESNPESKVYVEYYYEKGRFKAIQKNGWAEGTIYRKLNADGTAKRDGINDVYFSFKDGERVYFKGEYTNKSARAEQSTDEYPIELVQDMRIDLEHNPYELTYTANIRVIPKIGQVYQLGKDYTTPSDNLYGLIANGTYNSGTYLYWDGIKFRPITNRYNDNDEEIYNSKQDYGSLTVGTRLNNNIQDDDTIGRHSLEVGTDVEATGDNAVATGNLTKAKAHNSHAEGESVVASGVASHAEGYFTEALSVVDPQHNKTGSVYNAYAAHAEGSGYGDAKVKATARGAHAEGYAVLNNDGDLYTSITSKDNLAAAPGSHVEGSGTTVTENGWQGHAEGKGTTVSGKAGHAEGVKTTVSASYGHAEGKQTTVSEQGQAAHAEGYKTTASKQAAHAEGESTTASGRAAHAEGKNTTASGNNASAKGESTTAAALNSHAEGLGTKVTSTGRLSHIEGLGDYSELVEYFDGENDFFGENGGKPSQVSGIASHAEGYAQTVSGKYNHAEGRLNTISGQYVTAAHAEGTQNTINDNANYSHVEGELNTINEGCRDVHVEGAGNTADRNYQHLSGVLSKTTHNVDTFYGTHNNNSNAKPVTFAIGGGFDSVNLVEDRENSAKKRNIFAVTEDGDTYAAGHLEIDGTSDLSNRVTIGDSVSNHELALEVLKHSKFDQNVTIERDPAVVTDSFEDKLDELIDWDNQVDNSLKVKGESLFGDTLTIGAGVTETYYKYNTELHDGSWIVVDPETTLAPRIVTIYGYHNLPQTPNINATYIYRVLGGTFWDNWDNSDNDDNDTIGLSTFTGLNVHGEIRNERIPNNLYTSMTINGEVVPNEFADKFFVNSSIATATATYRGVVTPEDYNPKTVHTGNYSQVPSGLTEVDLTDENITQTFPLYYLDQDTTKVYKVKYKDTNIEHAPAQDEDTIYVWYTFEDNGGQEINPNDWDQMSAWLNTHVLRYADSNILTVATDRDLPPDSTNRWYKINENGSYKYYQYNWTDGDWDSQNNAPTGVDATEVTELPVPDLIIASENKIYHTEDEDKYYQWIFDTALNKWEYIEVDATPDKNDYCYVQIWEPDYGLDYVLFSDIYNLDGTPARRDVNTDVTAREKKKIICHRYKFVQVTHPTTEQVIDQTWRFEYQLNDSSFTQAQWDTINSGISKYWMHDIETQVTNERLERISSITEINSTLNKCAKLTKEVGNGTKPIYIKNLGKGAYGFAECTYNVSAQVGANSNPSKNNGDYLAIYKQGQDLITWSTLKSTDISLKTDVCSQWNNFVASSWADYDGYIKNWALGQIRDQTENFLIASDLNGFLTANDLSGYALENKILSSWSTDIGTEQNQKATYDQYIKDYVEENYVTATNTTDWQYIYGYKVFDKGIYIKASNICLQASQNSSGTFYLPNTQSGGILLSQSNIISNWNNIANDSTNVSKTYDEYIKKNIKDFVAANYVTTDNIDQTIKGIKTFAANEGIKFSEIGTTDAAFLQRGPYSTGTYKLPQVTTGGELALKSQVDSLGDQITALGNQVGSLSTSFVKARIAQYHQDAGSGSAYNKNISYYGAEQIDDDNITLTFSITLINNNNWSGNLAKPKVNNRLTFQDIPNSHVSITYSLSTKATTIDNIDEAIVNHNYIEWESNTTGNKFVFINGLITYTKNN